MFCGRCGTNNLDGAQFCQSCGAAMPAATAAAPAAQTGDIRSLPTSEFGGFWMRFIAVIIDTVIVGVIGGIVGAMANVANASDAASGAGLLATAIYDVGAPVLWGAHIGKLVFGYRLVTADGQRLTVGTSFLRYLCTYLSAAVLLIGYITAAFDSRKQAWHDKIAGTYVVRAQHAQK